MAFKQRENITYFLEQAKAMGVGDLYSFVTIDLYEEKNLTKVLDCLMEIQKIYDQDKYKASLKEAKEVTPVLLPEDHTPNAEKADLSLATSNSLLTATGEGNISTMNQDEELRKQLKYIPKLALACQKWVEALVKIEKPEDVHFDEWLRSGVILCKVMNTISPNSVTNIYEGNQSFAQRENIMNYNQAVRKLGVAGHDMFDTADLYDGKNFNMVLTHLNALANLCVTLPGYHGPTIEDTSQAKNLYGDSLLGTSIVIDEEKPETFSTEEQTLVDWCNDHLKLWNTRQPESQRVGMIYNIESLRTGVKIIRLLSVFIASFDEYGSWIQNPTTIVDFVKNAAYIISNLQSFHFKRVPGVTMQDIASGERVPMLKLLNFIRDKHDETALFESFMQTIDVGDDELTRFIEQNDLLLEPIMLPTVEHVVEEKVKKPRHKEKDREKAQHPEGEAIKPHKSHRSSSTSTTSKSKPHHVTPIGVSVSGGLTTPSAPLSPTSAHKKTSSSKRHSHRKIDKDSIPTSEALTPAELASDSVSSPAPSKSKRDKHSEASSKSKDSSSDKSVNRSNSSPVPKQPPAAASSTGTTPDATPSNKVKSSKSKDRRRLSTDRRSTTETSIKSPPISKSKKSKGESPEKSKDKEPKVEAAATPQENNSPKEAPNSVNTTESPTKTPSGPLIQRARSHLLTQSIAPERLAEIKKIRAAEMMREHVINEIKSSEFSYSESLRYITEKLVSKVTEANLVTAAEHYMLFANIEELAAVHKAFYERLAAVVDGKQSLIEFAKAEFPAVVGKYQGYLSNFPTASLSLEQLKVKYPSLGKLCLNYEIFQEGINGLKIRDILIMPVQRVPRYIMLLEQLARYTPETTLSNVGTPRTVSPRTPNEKRQIEELRGALQEKLLYFNSKIERDLESQMTKVWDVVRRVTDEEGNKMQKVFPINIKRKLLMHGPVKIKSVDSTMAIIPKERELTSKKYLSKKKVYMFVFDDTVLVTQLPKKVKTDMVYPFLEAGKISHPSEFDKTKEDKFNFEMDTETFWVTVTGEEECKKWVTAMQIHAYQDFCL